MCSLALVACSTTSTVPDDDKLYTGMRSTKYENVEKDDHFYAVQEELEEALGTAPNNSIFGSAYYRWPWPPFRLWIHNAFAKSDDGIGKWIGKTFGKRPVLLSSVNPLLHTQFTFASALVESMSCMAAGGKLL